MRVPENLLFQETILKTRQKSRQCICENFLEKKRRWLIRASEETNQTKLTSCETIKIKANKSKTGSLTSTELSQKEDEFQVYYQKIHDKVEKGLQIIISAPDNKVANTEDRIRGYAN